jgi:glutamate carboxypeptidase
VADCARAVLDWLSGQQEAMLVLLEELVNIDSGSDDPEGIARVNAAIARFLAGYGLRPDPPDPRLPDLAVFRLGHGPDRAPDVLLLGHCDTVWPRGEAARRPFRIEGAHARGPGVADMKAGLVCNCFLLAAFSRVPDPPSIAALFAPDEEIGSPLGGPAIERLAKGARLVFDSEPARADGTIVIANKGVARYELTVEGRAAHAGNGQKLGINAIEELAGKIREIHALTDLDAEITANVGVVEAGIASNMIAPSARALFEVRYRRPDQFPDLVSRLQRICEHRHVAGSRSGMRLLSQMKPLVRTAGSDTLYAVYRSVAAELGFGVEGIVSGGGANAGFACAAGTPTLCAVGPAGGKAHTVDEFLIVDTIVPRTKAIAATICRAGWCVTGGKTVRSAIENCGAP